MHPNDRYFQRKLRVMILRHFELCPFLTGFCLTVAVFFSIFIAFHLTPQELLADLYRKLPASTFHSFPSLISSHPRDLR